MGKRKRLNRFITKWIKSDLPDDRSTVLLLGVTRIPTTPTAVRRPCSLPLGTTTPQPPKHPPPIQHNSRKNSFSTRKGVLVRRHSSGSHRTRQNCPAPGGSTHVEHPKRVAFSSQNSSTDLSSPESSSTVSDRGCSATCSDDVTPSRITTSSDFTPGPVMDRSVDSIGACSLDAEASVDVTDWSEQSSVGTLRSVSLPTPEPQPHLPSYLSLACTVSGYSTTTNYDPERLARSRDASPHRLYDDLNSATPPNRNSPLYTIRNNLLSPPNVVPLPHQKYTTSDTPKMEEHLVARREFYSSSTRTTSFMSKESQSFVTSMFSNDSIDGCLQNGFQNGQNKCVTMETKSMSYISNGSGKTMSETSYKEFSNGLENKSFIQQRVERLYGPGALAQGFFISKRQKNRSYESESDKNSKTVDEIDKHSKSMTDKLLNVPESESNLKQSASSPTLPVLRHLRPEFRAQLPIISPKKGVNEGLPKSSTVPILKEQVQIKVNGHSKSVDKEDVHLNGNQNVIAKDDIQSGDAVKDGHYFLNIIEEETKRLLLMADLVEKDLETEDLSEEVKGKLRAASGKARLLSSQKIQQFKGLCTNNITQPAGAAFPTTNEDLQGFWDMVLLQVDQVNTIFKEIDLLRANKWQEVIPDVVDKATVVNGKSKPRKVVNRARPPTNAAAEEARKEREAKRKQMIEERRKAMREQMQQKKENIEIYVPGSS